MDAKFLLKHSEESEKIIEEAIRVLKSYKLARISEILGLNSGTIHNWITKKSSLSSKRAAEILLKIIENRSAPSKAK